jgi:hypothetical protein
MNSWRLCENNNNNISPGRKVRKGVWGKHKRNIEILCDLCASARKQGVTHPAQAGLTTYENLPQLPDQTGTHAWLAIRQLLDRMHQRLCAAPAMSDSLQFPVQAAGQFQSRQCLPHLLAFGQRNLQVLDEAIDHKARCIKDTGRNAMLTSIGTLRTADRIAMIFTATGIILLHQ